MRVLHLSSDDVGPAGRLHRGLLRLGCDSAMFVADRIGSDVEDSTITVFQPPSDLVSRLRRRLRSRAIRRSNARYAASRPPGFGWFFDDRSTHGADLLPQLPPADVINQHTMMHLIDYTAFFASVPRHTPVVRTLHDMAFFTGGCHYTWDCSKYTQHCGGCPQLGSHRESDPSREIWYRKHSALETIQPDRLHLVAPCRWLADEARRSSLLQKFPITVIPYGLDTEVFSPRDRGTAREVLGISPQQQVVLFVADGISRPEKGFPFLLQALKNLAADTNLLLVSVGGGNPSIAVPVPQLHFGHLNNERFLSMIYSAADVFVVPSIQDNFPQTVLEVTACGTPVAGFATGGIPEIVRHGVTGLLAPARNVSALSHAISELLNDPSKRQKMAANCRRLALAEYSLEIQAQRYISLYRSIVSR